MLERVDDGVGLVTRETPHGTAAHPGRARRETREIAVKRTGIPETLRTKLRQSQRCFWADRHDMAAFAGVFGSRNDLAKVLIQRRVHDLESDLLQVTQSRHQLNL